MNSKIDFTFTDVWNARSGRQKLGIDLESILSAIAALQRRTGSVVTVRGETGKAGAEGETGMTGLTGEQGPEGPAGPAGPQGPPGLAAGTALVDFGAFPGVPEAQTLVLDENVASDSAIQVAPSVTATPDHSETDVYLEEFSCQAQEIGDGSFILLARPRVGKAFGSYRFNYFYA